MAESSIAKSLENSWSLRSAGLAPDGRSDRYHSVDATDEDIRLSAYRYLDRVSCSPNVMAESR
jgi:hypothetical protein